MLSNINKQYIEDYIRECIKNNEFRKIEDYAKENHIPIIHPEVAQLLKILIKIHNPKKILELGTAVAYSAMIMAGAMKSKGELVTIERREDMFKLANKNINDYNYNDRIRVIQGEALEVLPNIDEKFDLIFIDAAKGKYMKFLNYCIEIIKPGGMIVSDNILFKGMIANDDLVVRRKKTIVRRMREYVDYICNNSLLETSLIPIGDGLAVSYMKEDKNE